MIVISHVNYRPRYPFCLASLHFDLMVHGPDHGGRLGALSQREFQKYMVEYSLPQPIFLLPSIWVIFIDTVYVLSGVA